MGMRTINKLNITFLLSLICLQLSAEIRCKTYSTAYMHALRSILISIFLFVYAQFGLAQVSGVVEPTACPTDFYSVYYGNHRAVSVLGQLSGGKISPDDIVGTWRGGQPLTAGQLSNLFFSGKLGSCNRNYRGLPWVDVFKAKDICDNFDLKLLTSIDGLQEGQAIVLIEGTPGQVDYRKIRARLGCESMPVCDLVDNLGRGVQFIDADGNLIPQGKQVPSLASPPRGPAPHAQTPTVQPGKVPWRGPSLPDKGWACYATVTTEQSTENGGHGAVELALVSSLAFAKCGPALATAAAPCVLPAVVIGGAVGAGAKGVEFHAQWESDCSDRATHEWRSERDWCENHTIWKEQRNDCYRRAAERYQDALNVCQDGPPSMDLGPPY